MWVLWLMVFIFIDEGFGFRLVGFGFLGRFFGLLWVEVEWILGDRGFFVRGEREWMLFLGWVERDWILFRGVINMVFFGVFFLGRFLFGDFYFRLGLMF